MAKSSVTKRQVFEAQRCLVPELNAIGYDLFPKADPSLGAHAHAGAYELCYLVAGSVEWWAGDEVTQVGPGEVYVTRPDERHGGTDAFMHPCELYWMIFHFPLQGLSRADNETLMQSLAGMRLRTFRASPRIADCCRKILDEHLAPGPLATVVVRAALYEMLAQVVRDYEAAIHLASAAVLSPAIRQALQWMDLHLCEDYSVDEVAAAVHLKPSWFHERFVAETGFSPAEYRTRQRIVRAKQLLRSPDVSVTNIAFDLGFSTSQYFATVFKNQVGLSPRQYRQRSQQQIPSKTDSSPADR
jgi:AraC-like DNA-binding protein